MRTSRWPSTCSWACTSQAPESRTSGTSAPTTTSITPWPGSSPQAVPPSTTPSGGTPSSSRHCHAHFTEVCSASYEYYGLAIVSLSKNCYDIIKSHMPNIISTFKILPDIVLFPAEGDPDNLSAAGVDGDPSQPSVWSDSFDEVYKPFELTDFDSLFSKNIPRTSEM